MLLYTGYLDGHDRTTQAMLKEILASEEEHAEDLASLLEGMKPRNGKVDMQPGYGRHGFNDCFVRQRTDSTCIGT